MDDSRNPITPDPSRLEEFPYSWNNSTLTKSELLLDLKEVNTRFR